MSELERIRSQLQRLFPLGTYQLAHLRSGQSILDARYEDVWVVVRWTPPALFGVARLSADDDPVDIEYETFDSAVGAIARALGLLSAPGLFLPCPFCGSTDVEIADSPCGDVFVQCQACQAEGAHTRIGCRDDDEEEIDLEEEARVLWNTRTGAETSDSEE